MEKRAWMFDQNKKPDMRLCRHNYLESWAWKNYWTPEQPPCPNCAAELRELQLEKEALENRKKRIERAFHNSAFGPEYYNKSFDNYNIYDLHQAKTKKIIETWAKGICHLDVPHSWLLLYGGPGTGKTHFAAASFSYIIENGKICGYFEADNLLDQIKKKGAKRDDTSQTYQEQIERLMEANCIILDDFGVRLARKKTEIDDIILFNLFNLAYKTQKALMMSTTLTIDRFNHLFNPAILDRFQERLKTLNFTWPSFRERNKNQ
jgi:DNA replication protein DnaC